MDLSTTPPNQPTVPPTTPPPTSDGTTPPSQAHGGELAIAYEKDYEVDDKALYEPFVVLKAIKAGRPAWWNGEPGRLKVMMLINAFKLNMNTQDALVYAGISHGQFVTFCKVHENFLSIKDRLKRSLAVIAQQGLLTDLQNPDDPRTRQWFLERTRSEQYGRNIGAGITQPPGAAAKLTAEAFLDEKGKVIVSKQTAEYLEHEDENNS